MTNQIKEVKGIDAENFEWLLAQSDYKINSVFRSANKSVNIYPNTPLVSNKNKVKATTYTPPGTMPSDKSASGTFDFVINATDNALIDLKDYCFDVNCFAFVPITNANVSYDILPTSINDLHFANQPLFPLFAHAEIYIDNVQLERSDNLALSAGIRYTMEYDHSNKAEDAAQINGWQYSDYVERQPVFNVAGNAFSNTAVAVTISTLDENTQLCKFKPNKTISGIINGNGTNTLIYVNINQKIKLSDMFSCINSLPPIFGHQIKISLSRASSSWIGCDTRCRVKMQLDNFETFKLNGVQYIITDELKAAAQKYYSRKIETIFTSRIENLNVIPSQPSGTNEISYVLTVPLAYKNKCLCIAIPKCGNVFGALQPYTFSDKILDGAPTKANGLYYSEFGKTFNEYVGPALSQIVVSTANGLELARYEFDRDGTMDGDAMSSSDFMAGFDLRSDPTNTLRYSYLQAYEEMKRCREHFNQLPESCISYLSFLKSYMVYCVDLSPFSISAGENIRITLKCGQWGDGYNPFFLYNRTGLINNITTDGKYSATSILLNLYSDQILRLLPNGKSEIVQLFSEPEPMNVNETA